MDVFSLIFGTRKLCRCTLPKTLPGYQQGRRLSTLLESKARYYSPGPSCDGLISKSNIPTGSDIVTQALGESTRPATCESTGAALSSKYACSVVYPTTLVKYSMAFRAACLYATVASIECCAPVLRMSTDMPWKIRRSE